ncbi:hypothetical protein VTL71DRAFT_616 [Oculimacula yallundae]|uniref:Uncharacterized protein n=1 Tax=Oculimacula yallundae TaxID=86028 RepID=A0ABR4D0L2_9HELO
MIKRFTRQYDMAAVIAVFRDTIAENGPLRFAFSVNYRISHIIRLALFPFPISSLHASTRADVNKRKSTAASRDRPSADRCIDVWPLVKLHLSRGRTNNMTQLTSYQELEERLELLENAHSSKQRTLEEGAQKKRAELQLQKINKLSTTDTEARAQEHELGTDQYDETNDLKDKYAGELEQIHKRHKDELAERMQEHQQAKDGLRGKHLAEREKLQMAFEEEETAIEAGLKEEMLQLRASYEADEEKIKNELYEYAKSRRRQSHLSKPPILDALTSTTLKYENGSNETALKLEHRDKPQAEIGAQTLPKKQTFIPDQAMSCNKELLLNPLGKRESLPGAFDKTPHALHPLCKRMNRLREISKNGRKQYPQVLVSIQKSISKSCSSAIQNTACYLWKQTSETLYLDKGVAIFRPVSLQEGKQVPEPAATWFIESSDIEVIQTDQSRCLGGIKLKAGYVWIRFMDVAVMKTFLHVLNEYWPGIERTILSKNYKGVPPEFED